MARTLRATRAKPTRRARPVTQRREAPVLALTEPTFLDRVPALFAANQQREAREYDRLIYNLDPPARGDALARLAGFRGAKPPKALTDAKTQERITRIMRTIRYPAVAPLGDLADVDGLTLPALTTVLAFHHPAYPIYSRQLVAALNRLGVTAVYRESIDEIALRDYAGVLAALDRLKERLPFERVPESNCFLTRVVEGALVETAR
ncbi:MAG: hypothetical protein ACYDCK_07910 [Thermoplasmatota archaeon]